MCIAASAGVAFSRATGIADVPNGCAAQVAVAASILGECATLGFVATATTSSNTITNRKPTVTTASEGSSTAFIFEEIY